MTSHHDVAGVMARAKTKAALLRMGEPVAYGSDAAAIEDLLAIVESQAKALSEAEAELRDSERRFLTQNPYAEHNKVLEARATAAEARLAEVVAERDAWRTRESETQEALQAIGDEFGVYGGEPRTYGIRRVLTEMRAFRTEAMKVIELIADGSIDIGGTAIIIGSDARAIIQAARAFTNAAKEKTDAMG